MFFLLHDSFYTLTMEEIKDEHLFLAHTRTDLINLSIPIC